MRYLGTVAVFIVMLLVCTGTFTVLTIPDTPKDAMETANIHGKGSSYFVWTSQGETYSLTLDVSQDDFESSIDRNILRIATKPVLAPYNLIEPDNPYIVSIAEHILERNRDRSDPHLATVCLDFVQSTIHYHSDTALYGCEDFWASPTETLYLRAGDCEDTSVLLASLLEAVGLDAVLLDYVGHMATGVRLDSGAMDGLNYAHDGGTYYFCETATDFHMDIGKHGTNLDPDTCRIWEPSDSNGWIVIPLAWYRNVIRGIFSI